MNFTMAVTLCLRQEWVQEGHRVSLLLHQRIQDMLIFLYLSSISVLNQLPVMGVPTTLPASDIHSLVSPLRKTSYLLNV